MFSDHESVSRSSFSSVGSLFHACGAATDQALSPSRRRIRGTTRLPHDEARSVDRPGILATDVRRSEIIRRVSKKRLVNQQAQLVLDPLSDWQPVQLSKTNFTFRPFPKTEILGKYFTALKILAQKGLNNGDVPMFISKLPLIVIVAP